MKTAIVCFSHLRWDFVYQRPQHILSRLAVQYPVVYFEEAIYGEAIQPSYNIYRDATAEVYVVTPHLPGRLSEEDAVEEQRRMIEKVFGVLKINSYLLWYYAPMAYRFTDHLEPELVVYDCMDELSAFLFAPPALKENELALMNRADLVFTGGRSLFNAKKDLHEHIFCFPSSIDKAHFGLARKNLPDPADQVRILFPRIGFFGVIDERLDTQLLLEVAAERPDWQFILIGPVVKIDPAILPQGPNLHYLGPKSYNELPYYLSGWNIAMMPFARNESTRFISPTKTPEYLAGGKPVIAPSIEDVVNPYGNRGLVAIADTADEFISAARMLLEEPDERWLRDVDSYLENLSWDNTVQEMSDLIEGKLEKKGMSSLKNMESYV